MDAREPPEKETRMAKTLVIGDIHLKAAKVLKRADEVLAERPGITRVVVTGDICDEWHASNGQMMNGVEEFVEWVEGQRAEGLQVDVVFGNHDFQYLLGKPGPGTQMSLIGFVRTTLFPLGLKAACEANGFLISHAGLTQTFADEHLDAPADAQEAAEQLNVLLDEGTLDTWHALFSRGIGRGGWSIPGPLWADKWELEEDPADGIPQIVGHTPVPTVCQADRPGLEGAAPLWFVDTFSLRSDGVPIGDGTMLLLDEGAIHVV